jgi:hypothetical protein
LLIVLAFAGDSTMTIFMSFQMLTGKIKAGSAGLALAVSNPNMGAAQPAVKSTDVEDAGFGVALISGGLQNTCLELHSQKG